MKIYTRGGDAGETGLVGGARVRKTDLRVEACGAVDEANCAIGLARQQGLPDELDRLLESLQHMLFTVGAELAAVDERRQPARRVEEHDIARMERAIDRMEAELPPLTQFILPAGAGAPLHAARGACRHAERRVVALIDRAAEPVSPQLPACLNRLSDLLFVAARWAASRHGESDVAWSDRWTVPID